MKNLKLNTKKVAVALFNSALNLVFFFSLRRSLLRVTGCRIGVKTTVHRKVIFFSFGKFSVGKNCTINYNCYMDNRVGIRIGDNVNISHNTKIYTLGHDIDDPMSRTVGKPVVIEDNVWIFPSVMIMPGVTIGKGAVVYPGSVVTRNIEAYSIAGGNPAKHIRFRNKNIQYSADFPIWFAL
ncbi:MULTISPECIES: DapH/DapD/GlmU-related protein [Pseudomonas]|uniref:Acyltransferase n=1 Tax=Pseudomonas frederiksbergensis TaxID=104087 RepID=A0A2S8HB96_9PSED|nr:MULTISPECIES: acyltransferase [Pseudomonas]PQO99704.1 acyltransferase [Pseudomonas frederiksbergensis]WLG49034.1 acyltransferase [Pseudomonas sp. FP1742]